MGKHLPGVLGRLQRWSYLRGRVVKRMETGADEYMRGWAAGNRDVLEALRMKLREEADSNAEAQV